MSRPEPRAPGARSPNLEELEELGDDAIIAQQTEAHLPQKRIVVSDEERSVVIAEEAAPERTLRHYRPDRGEPTIVIRDRNALDAFRRKLAEKQRQHRGRRRAPYVWAGLALAAFAMGGLLTLALMGDDPAEAVDTELGARIAAPVRRVERVEAQPAPEPTRAGEVAPPQVKLEELPVERPRRR